MAKQAIREFDAKRMLARGLAEVSGGRFSVDPRVVLVSPDTDLDGLAQAYPWLESTRLVVKPDQLFGKRGKNNLLCLNASLEEARQWIRERMGREITITQTTGRTTGTLTHFLIEPFVPHGREYYIAITTAREHDSIHFSTQGGVDIEEAWSSVVETRVGILDDVGSAAVELPADLDDPGTVAAFARALYEFFVSYHFTYLEINPFALEEGKVVLMDVKSRVDDYAAFPCAEQWGKLEFPKPFGTARTPEERRVEEIDERTGASLKLNVLNPRGRIWNLVAGGGASVIYADTVVDLGLAGELANYGEYSGDPSMEDTYEYTRVVLDLMTREKDPQGRPKFLLIGGGIANFTDVASTFTGIIKAIEEYADRLKAVDARILVRRGGPNFETGLANMRALGERLQLPIRVYGPETHMTKIVRMVLED
ncbi:MAG TPA: ATP citrate lyase citrate-binding domain-containing protein [Acidimicrobiia bacterium]|nr:ATP citrate lyase citrate-binding domain-containing protein [Acidimicrobiia bacterium]